MGLRISTTLEQDRKYDIDFVNWTEEVYGEAQFTFSARTKKTTGIIKAVNRFLKILLTHKGSDPFNREIGTYFDDITELGGYTDEELGTYVTEQLGEALSQVIAIQADNSFPEDENLSTVTLESIERLAADQARFYVTFITEAGAGVTVKVPNIGG